MSTEVKKTLFWLFTHKIGDYFGPIGSIFGEKESAEYSATLSKRSNNPTVIEVFNHEYVEALETDNKAMRSILDKLYAEWLRHGCAKDTMSCLTCKMERELDLRQTLSNLKAFKGEGDEQNHNPKSY